MPKPLFRTASAFLGLSAAFLALTSCASTDRSEDSGLQRDLDNEASFISESGYSYWADPGPSAGPLRVTIRLPEQTAYVYRGDRLTARSRVATGLPGHRTPSGEFTIIEKSADKRSNLYGRILDSDGEVVVADADIRKHEVPPDGTFVGAAMPYWMRLTPDGIGLHVGPIPDPGQPASHGCVRMPRQIAEKLFATAPLGTPVEIVRR